MRSALISLAGQPREISREEPLTLAGKTVARRQLDFALAAGCEAVIVLGDGGSAEAIALRHAAELAGARFQAVRDSHGLLGAVRADDELLVLAPGLLPEAPAAIEALAKGRRVLVFPAGPAVAAGFERIDANRAWAGALVVGGPQVERLSDLPADIALGSALVRIAMQANVRERPLPDDLLADGSWRMLGERVDQASSDRAWLDRHKPVTRPFAPTRWLVNLALRAVAPRALATPRAAGGMALASLAAMAGSILGVLYGLPVVGLALVGLAVFLAFVGAELFRLRRVPFGRTDRSAALYAAIPWLIDGVLLACAVITIGGTWPHRLFPPLVMLGTLYAARPEIRRDWGAVFGDRGLLALVLAVAAGFGLVEPAIMLLSLALIAFHLVQSGARRG